jgi:hypothetical protein
MTRLEATGSDDLARQDIKDAKKGAKAEARRKQGGSQGRREVGAKAEAGAQPRMAKAQR